MSVQKIDLPSKELQDEIRSGGVVRPGDRIAVVSVGLGEQVFVVTAVDQDVIRGESVEVPIDEVVTLEKRKVAPVRTGLAIYGGAFLVGMAVVVLFYVGLLLGGSRFVDAGDRLVSGRGTGRHWYTDSVGCVVFPARTQGKTLMRQWVVETPAPSGGGPR